MKLKEVLKHLTGYYFIILCDNMELICTNHEDYLNTYPKATEEILKQYENYKVYEINGAYDGGTSPWIDLYIDKDKEEN